MYPLVDMHCHIDLYENPVEVAKLAANTDAYILSVTTTPRAWRDTYKLTRKYRRIKTALGFHPQLAHIRSGELPLFEALLPETDYVGEIGLDGSKDFKQYQDIQLGYFRSILNLCTQAGGKILSIHSRGAASAVLDELTEQPNSGIPILHWFSGSRTQLQRAIDLGCWFSVGPAMLNSKSGIELLERMPIDRILTETDGPFAKSEGKIIYPANVSSALQRIADYKNVSIDTAGEIISENLRQLTGNS